MQVIVQSYDSPFQNLAYEQWLFEHFEGEFLRLWINPTSVIVGKHQNALAECNFHYCQLNHIPIIRRISGGGTVFHDMGNINFSFFRNLDKSQMINYDRNLNFISTALNEMGYPVIMNKRHDLYLNDRKISGNAQHMRMHRVLHHGTILYDSNTSMLGNAIKRKSGEFTDKAVKSVRSPVANLREFKDSGSTTSFLKQLLESLNEQGLTIKETTLPTEAELNGMIASKYASNEWNFGYSPPYEFENEAEHIRAKLHVERGGKIIEAKIAENGQSNEKLNALLLGKNHFYSELNQVLISEYSSNANLLLKALF